MKRKVFLYAVQMIGLLVWIMGCSVDTDPQEAVDEYIAPRTLTIGVAGNPPEVRETRVQFKQVDLEQLNKNIDESIDALFIMPEHHKKAAEPQYAALYRKLPYPVFFIHSKKSWSVYTDEHINYDDLPDDQGGMYAWGIYKTGTEKEQRFAFGLYNDVENEANIKGMYSRIFKKIVDLGGHRRP